MASEPQVAKKPQPKRGAIYFVKLPSDPPDKNERPVVVVSLEARNSHERASTVMVVPLSTTPAKMPTHIPLAPGETGLSEPSWAQAEGISTVRKESLQAPRQQTRRLSELTLSKIARGVVMAMGFPDWAVHLENNPKAER
jgi:mRNA-degrading endonuclease toxin of MazEF toxin-antitoxin module